MFSKKEERLNLCVPGGKETARMLKALHAEIGTRAGRRSQGTAAAARTAASPQAPPARSRDNPGRGDASCRATRLNKPGSAKETWHIEFDLDRARASTTRSATPSGFIRTTIRRWPTPSSGRSTRRRISRSAAARLREVLIDGVSLAPAPDMLFQLFSYITGGERRQKAKALAAGEDPDGDAATLDVLAAIEKFPGVRPDPEAFIEALDPLQPRLYSISSSPKVRRRAAWRSPSMRCATTSAGAQRLGVASTFLAERVEPGDTAPRLCAEGARTSACRPIRPCRSS